MKRKTNLLFLIMTLILMLSACNRTGEKDISNDIISPDTTPLEDTSNEAVNVYLKKYEIGETVKFGGYEWLVLDIRDGKALLLTEEIISIKFGNISNEAEEALSALSEKEMKFWGLTDFDGYNVFNTKYDGIYDAYVSYESMHPKIFNSDMWYSSWENCSLRKWLNSEMDFTSKEWDMIETTEVADKTGLGNNTLDKVFLLDYNEVIKYFPRNEARAATSIASDEELLYFLKHSLLLGSLSGDMAEKALNTKNNGIFYWWVRGAKTEDNYIKPMSTDDELRSIAPSPKKPLGVRPAIWININR